ncbi:MAG: four helix bundle protein [Candidatus Liptonbacteria bacterium]|nr:four helix bundle protein [Candidatus Liptonbacteria bacterium]
MQSYRDLGVWQKSKRYAVRVYKITEKFPPHELYGLTSQMRRAGVSIPSGIAEGFRRKSKKEKAQFLRIAYGSGAELETQLEIGHDLGYITPAEYEELVIELEEIMKMLNKNIEVLESNVIK